MSRVSGKNVPKLYDKEGHLLPLCMRCDGWEAFPECDAYHWNTMPEHWRGLKVHTCDCFYYDNWWKFRGMSKGAKGSDFPTFRKPPVKGKQNTSKGSKWFDVV